MSITNKCYLSLSDVEDIYKHLNGSTQGLSAFREEANVVAMNFEKKKNSLDFFKHICLKS